MPLDGRLDVIVDEGVEFAFTVINTGSEPVDLEFRSGQVADFTVSEDNSVVWQWSEDKMFTQALQSETIAPDESVTYSGLWPDPDPGSYTVIATLEAVNASVDATAEFSV